MIDQMAHRYGMLPSDIISRATTFDMVVMDASSAYIEYLSNPNKAYENIPTEELLKIKERYEIQNSN